MYIVQLSKNVWLSDWDGDPGRTVIKQNAKKYKSKGMAKIALNRARTYRPFKYAKIIEV